MAVALDYSSLSSKRVALQKAADSAALAAVRELAVANTTDSQVLSAARTIVVSALRHEQRLKYTMQPEILDNRRAVRVVVAGTIENWFGKLSSQFSSVSVSAKSVFEKVAVHVHRRMRVAVAAMMMRVSATAVSCS